MENNSKPGECVYDPFLGSGTSVIAAEQIGRSCYGLEIEPGYVDVIVQRWQDFTNEEAVHEREKRTFGQIGKSRAKAQARAA